ncbi:MAG: nucleotide exchange factor GrpE [Pseudomonadota bacterium]
MSSNGKPTRESAPEAPPAASAAAAAPDSGADIPAPLDSDADIPPSPEDASPEASAAGRIQALEAEVARLKDQALRALAEAENTRRRASREIDEQAKFAIANLAREIVPVADNLRRALDSIPQAARAADQRLDRFAAGVELTERELMAVFERYDIRRIDPLGQPFDHNYHQAIMDLDSPDKAPGTVVQVVQSGFTIHGRLLRPALVVVAKGNGAGKAGARVDTTV